MYGKQSMVNVTIGYAHSNRDTMATAHNQQEIFWRFVGAMNIITDVLLIALPLFIVYSLQMPMDKKIIVSSSFGTRIL
jgi:hypothetical protein